MRFEGRQITGKQKADTVAGSTLPAVVPSAARSWPFSLPRAPLSARLTGLAIFGAVGLLLLFGNRVAALYTDWLWFQSQGHGEIWRTLYGTRLMLFGLFGAASFLLACLNVRLADNFSPSAVVTLPLVFGPRMRPRVVWGLGTTVNGLPLNRTLQFIAGLRGILDRLLLTGALLFAVGAGLSAQTEWNSYLRYRHPVPWGQTDPLFHRDIGFYVFTLPWLRYVQGWLFTVFVLLGAGVTTVYLYQQGINWISEHHARVHLRNQSPTEEKLHFLSPIQPSVRAHLSALLFGVLLAKGFGYYLDRYDLLYGGGWLPGAGYTDVHFRLPMLHGAIAVVSAAGLMTLVNVWRRGIALPVFALMLWLGYSALGVVIPGAVQRFSVQPNEASREAPYLQRALTATRAGYGLDTLDVRPLRGAPSAANVDLSSALWDDVPLWEPAALRARFALDAPLPPWETTPMVYLDRYPVIEKGGAQARLAALGTHEITRDGLEGTAQTWLSRHLRYTHGSGLTACLVGGAEGAPGESQRIDLRQGTPRYLTARAAPALGLTRPQIYFGASPPDEYYVLINTRQPEVEPDNGQGAAQTDVGLPLTPLARAALTARFGTWSLLLSHDITPTTRLLLLRSVSEQVKRFAPFLLLDSAPCPVVYGGQVHWIVTGYLTASAFPGSALTSLSDNLSPLVSVNYIRPSVLADVDAASGQVRLYAADARLENDPLLRSYQACFPDVIAPASAMPDALRAHRRYPLGLLTLQRQLLAQYHASDVDAFYSHSDVWEVPRETYREPAEAESFLTRYDPGFLPGGGESETAPAPPRYMMARLSGASAAAPPEFVLQAPLLLPGGNRARGAGRLAGVLVGRSDGAAWGTLQWYGAGHLPGDTPVYSASAVAERFEQAASRSDGADGTINSNLPGEVRSSAPARLGKITVGPVRLVLAAERLFYVQAVFFAARAESVVPGAGGTAKEEAASPHLWRVRVSDGFHLAEAATVRDALKVLNGKEETK